MSSFLMPIHEEFFWKLKEVNERMNLLVSEGMLRWSEATEEAQWMAWEDYGQPLARHVQLDKVIDKENIHGWLHERLLRVECREAAFMAYLAERVGQEAYEMGKEIYFEDGLREGRIEKSRTGIVSSPLEIYKKLRYHLLNGMPCDQIDEVLEDSPEVCHIHKNTIPQREAWRRTNVDALQMEEMYLTWMKGFYSAFEPGYLMTVEKNGLGVDFFITKK